MSIGYKKEDYGNWNEIYDKFVKKNLNKLKPFGRLYWMLKNK
jgi:hypothetical protein